MGGQKDRSEPTALFFAVFGLVFEALAASSADARPTTQLRAHAVIALQALASLVRPEYAGRALLDPPVFDELANLCYRMAMTESAPVQCHLVEVLSAFAVSQKDRLLPAKMCVCFPMLFVRGGLLNPFDRNGRSKDHVLPESMLTRIFRITAYILQNSISGPGGIKTC